MNETPNGGEPVTLPLGAIAVDPSLQVRAGLNQPTIRQYAAAIESGAEFPPLVVARQIAGWVLLDGFHRRRALIEAGLHEVECRVIEADRKEWRWIAAQANLRHGLRLKPRELREVFRAYVRAGQHQQGKGFKSYRDMAGDLPGVAYTTLRNWMVKDYPRVAKAIGGSELRGEGGLQRVDHDKLAAGQAVEHIASALAILRTLREPSHRVRVGVSLFELVEEVKAAGLYEPSDY